MELHPAGQAWILNGYRIIYNVRIIKRGKNKGLFECLYRKGYKFKKTIINNFKPLKEV
jgi:DNA-binding winged helix-turn-helix (wHTH) protein